jgi:transposase
MNEDRSYLRNEQWSRIEHLCPGKRSDRGRTAADNRLFVEAVLYVARTGIPWRDLPSRFGDWNSTYKRFARWSESGVWERIFAELSRGSDLGTVAIDSTIVRAHQHAAGAEKKKGDQSLGRSRGGLTTKIHCLVEAAGNLVHFCLTGGNAHDSTQAVRLLDTIPAEHVIADKAYDSNAIAEAIEARGAQVVIPSQARRKVQRVIDLEKYKARNRIERFFCRLKGFRRIATRYEKLSVRFASFVLIVAAVVWKR